MEKVNNIPFLKRVIHFSFPFCIIKFLKWNWRLKRFIQRHMSARKVLDSRKTKQGVHWLWPSLPCNCTTLPQKTHYPPPHLALLTHCHESSNTQLQKRKIKIVLKNKQVKKIPFVRKKRSFSQYKIWKSYSSLSFLPKRTVMTMSWDYAPLGVTFLQIQLRIKLLWNWFSSLEYEKRWFLWSGW